MDFLIIGSKRDPHVSRTCLALENLGHTCSHWSTDSILNTDSPSVEISNTSFHLDPLHFKQFDLIWYRKRLMPKFAEGDFVGKKFFVDESRAFLDGLLFSLESKYRFLNKPSSVLLASSKIMQLKIASQIKSDVEIPNTIFTNDPDKLMDFWEKCNKNIVYKPMTAAHIDAGGESFVIPTTKLGKHDLEAVDIISSQPSLYQACINKRYEVRVTIFGDNVYGVRVEGDSSHVDWRILFSTSPIYQIEIPVGVRDFCTKMLEILNLEYGAFDFGVDYEGCWNFFEVNDAGNFLFLQDRLPHLDILEKFSEYLVQFASQH